MTIGERSSTLISGRRFDLRRSSFYGVDRERNALQSFLNGSEIDMSDIDPWLNRVRNFRDTGRWIGRVHLISRPLTDYLRYEFAVYS